jgi:ABC-type transporter Mla MlaB component
MPSALSWNLQDEGGGLQVELVGEITEKSNFGALLDRLSGTVTLDLSRIRRINSRGVREWVDFVRGAQGKGVALIFQRCSVPFVHQLNMNSAFRGRNDVRSVYAPYFCPSCNAEHVELVDLAQAQPRIVDSVACPTCGAAMEFDDLPDKYLSFHLG